MSIKIPSRVLEERIKDADKDKAIMDLMDQLIILHESGALDTLVDLALTLKDVSSVITDDMFDNMVVMIRDLLEIMNNIVGNPVIKVIADSINDPKIDRALMELEDNDVGLAKVIGMLRDPDVLRGAYILLTLIKAIGARSKEYLKDHSR
ncbi:hypothetical protein VMUT_0844 [Vulcanisaeta moutnovskia 768-28]|uniref:DUF1641 domain-containing protein n=1 Tax=Vulcanisaeta moutnovskia (strain 768-28) TaxID=985053 RepID=F0QWK6_VULM7|nr:DUF1641 domain-containing protein [Vulcanisaeta moutnovskia]ADY01054.1 hypothetical protein VMUT_0844 [Vulcanisaeta moutnovskia 768-28]